MLRTTRFERTEASLWELFYNGSTISGRDALIARSGGCMLIPEYRCSTPVVQSMLFVGALVSVSLVWLECLVAVIAD